jgi:hypothetical protein
MDYLTEKDEIDFVKCDTYTELKEMIENQTWLLKEKLPIFSKECKSEYTLILEVLSHLGFRSGDAMIFFLKEGKKFCSAPLKVSSLSILLKDLNLTCKSSRTFYKRNPFFSRSLTIIEFKTKQKEFSKASKHSTVEFDVLCD